MTPRSCGAVYFQRPLSLNRSCLIFEPGIHPDLTRPCRYLSLVTLRRRLDKQELLIGELASRKHHHPGGAGFRDQGVSQPIGPRPYVVVLSHEGGVNFNPDRPIERNGRDGNPLRGLAGEGYSRGLFAQSARLAVGLGGVSEFAIDARNLDS